MRPANTHSATSSVLRMTMNCSRVLSMTHPALIDELKTLVEPGKVLTDADSLNAYGKDWTKHFAPAPTAIVFPKTTEQVQAIVRWANQHKVALVPSGGRTGLSAAAVAANGEVVVSFDYMNQVLDINLTDRTAVCQPGVVTEHLQNVAEEPDLHGPRHPGFRLDHAGAARVPGQAGPDCLRIFLRQGPGQGPWSRRRAGPVRNRLPVLRPAGIRGDH